MLCSLKHRRTFLEWDHKILGPIEDDLGFEQGGISSGDLYTVYNGDQLSTANGSKLGADLDGEEVSAIGQADDVVLLSHDIFLLKNLLQLTLDYCKKHHVTLAAEKTKLIVFAPKDLKHTVTSSLMWPSMLGSSELLMVISPTFKTELNHTLKHYSLSSLPASQETRIQTQQSL